MQEKEAVRHLLLPHIHLHTLPEGFSGPNVLVPLLLPHMALLLLLLLLLVNTSIYPTIPQNLPFKLEGIEEETELEKEVARAKSFTISKFSLRTGEETIRDADPREALKMVDTAQALFHERYQKGGLKCENSFVSQMAAEKVSFERIICPIFTSLTITLIILFRALSLVN
jgi:hypothetical protein